MTSDKLPPIKIPQRRVNLVLTWAKDNLTLLEELRDGKITGAQYKEQMKTMFDITVILGSEIKSE